MNILIQEKSENTLLLRWDVRIERDTLLQFEELLDSLPGVQRTSVERYSGIVGYADHVTSAQAFAEALRAQLNTTRLLGETYIAVLR